MENKIISKELLSAVMGVNNVEIGRDLDNRLEYYYNDGVDNIHNIINIHELAHKCKEWACKKRGFVISCNISRVDNYDWILDIEHLDFTIEVPEILDNYTFNTEPEAILKACQWILESKKDKNDK